MAILFAKRGAIVISCDIDEIGNAQTVDLIAREVPQTTTNEKRVFAYKCDIGNRDEVHALVDSIQRDVGDVTILVNNGESFEDGMKIFFESFVAAILSSKSILDMTEEEYSRTLNVDLFAAYWVGSSLGTISNVCIRSS